MACNHIYSFDVLKFFAILGIAVLHYHWQSLPQAYLGVEICFLISGFFLAVNYEKYARQNCIDTIKKRLNAFYFHYIIAFFISCLFIGSFHLNDLIASIFLLPEIGIGTKITPGVFWFLGAYIYVFTFFTILIKNINKNKLNYLIGILVFLSLLAMFKTLPTVCASLEKNVYIGIFPYGLIRAFAAIGIGYLVGAIKSTIPANPLKNYSSFIEIAALLFMIYIVFHKQTYKFDSIFYFVFSICMFSLSYKNSYFAKFLEHIGKKFNIIFSISLPIYIYHYFVVMKCGPYLQNSFPYIYIFIVLFISALMHILYKKRGYVYNFINKVIHEYQEKKWKQLNWRIW